MMRQRRQFPYLPSAGNGAPMRFVFALLAACLLMFSLASGTSASAAVSAEPTAAEMAFHHEGDGDQVPECPSTNGQHHHHLQTGEHCPGLLGSVRPVLAPTGTGQKIALTRDLTPPGMDPGSEPHPPRA